MNNQVDLTEVFIQSKMRKNKLFQPWSKSNSFQITLEICKKLKKNRLS